MVEPANQEEKAAKQKEDGKLFQQWISNPRLDGCKVSPASVTVDELEKDDFEWVTLFSVRGLPDGYSADKMNSLDLPVHQYQHLSLKKYSGQEQEIRWEGRVGKGAMFVENVFRVKYASGPYISELGIAAYKKNFNIYSLKYIFVTDIRNRDTRDYIIGTCPSNEVKVWEHGTSAYQRMLGTPIGKLAASVVLGAFDRGKRRIARITIWWTGRHHGHIQARFDVERISN